MRTATASLAVLFLAAFAHAGTWTVDDSGGADFLDLQDAIDTVLPGDILVVQPGFYDGFTLTKRLTIVGDPGTAASPKAKPEIQDKSYVLAPPNATLAGLSFEALELHDVSGALILDDVLVRGFWYSCDTFLIEGCASVLLSRVISDGHDEFGVDPLACETPGLEVVASHVVASDCRFTAGESPDEFLFGFPGVPGADIGANSLVVLARTTVTGGDGGDALDFGGTGGAGGEAVHLGSESATCIVRGNTVSELQGGAGGSGAFQGPPATYAVSGDGHLVISGVTWDPPALAPSLTKTFPNPAQPFAWIDGKDHPGATKRLNLYGPPGGTVLLWASVGTGYTTIAPVDGSVFLNPSSLLFNLQLTLISQVSPWSWSVVLPSSFAGLDGLVVTLQGFGQGLGAGGDWLALNPMQIIIR